MEAQSDDLRSREARVTASLEHSDAIRSALAAIVSAPPRLRSSISEVLEAFRGEIIAAHEHGSSAARIAAALKVSGVAFSEGSLRNAVRRMVSIASASPRHMSRRATASSPAPQVTPQAPVVEPVLSVTPPASPTSKKRALLPESGSVDIARNAIARLNEDL